MMCINVSVYSTECATCRAIARQATIRKRQPQIVCKADRFARKACNEKVTMINHLEKTSHRVHGSPLTQQRDIREDFFKLRNGFPNERAPLLANLACEHMDEASINPFGNQDLFQSTRDPERPLRTTASSGYSHTFARQKLGQCTNAPAVGVKLGKQFAENSANEAGINAPNAAPLKLRVHWHDEVDGSSAILNHMQLTKRAGYDNQQNQSIGKTREVNNVKR